MLMNGSMVDFCASSDRELCAREMIIIYEQHYLGPSHFHV